MNHEVYIKRCLQIARNGLGATRPNPSVGAVVVCDNVVIGEGFTSAYGGNHAEVNAINSVKNKDLLKVSTIYVTLEPCSHFGKTPPCADLIIKSQIKHVVIGCLDTNSLVAGKGIERLQKHGCHVTVGVMEKECKEHHRRFFTVQNKKRPFVILKWAVTKDGFIAPKTKEKKQPVWISNKFSKQLVHKWRGEEHAILVGTHTVFEDNPKLNVRSWSGSNPVRVVIDRDLKISKEYAVLDDTVKTIILSEKLPDLCHNFKNTSVELINFSENLAKNILEVLFKYQIQSVIIEGGAKTLQTFIDEGLWDEARVFEGKNEFKTGVRQPVLKHSPIKCLNVAHDLLKIYKND